MSVAASHQAELITDDPRCEGSVADLFADWKRFRKLSREHGGLLTSGQAAKLLDVPSGQVSVWCARGRLTSFEILGTKMVAAPEVLLLRKERDVEIRAAGGRGVKAPSLADLAKAAYEDTQD